MKKAILLSLLFVACVFTASAQKFALIDMEYILKNICLLYTSPSPRDA